jgi:hypothetical protein
LSRDARSLAERAIGVLTPLQVSESDDRRNRRREAEAYLLAGDTLAREGRTEEAKARWQQALSAVGPLAEGAREPLFLAALARTYQRLDYVDHAGPLLERLSDMGHRMPELEQLKKAKGV